MKTKVHSQFCWYLPTVNIKILYWSTALSDEKLRRQTYHHLLQQLPPDNHATLAALCGHLHMYDIKLNIWIHNYKLIRAINTEYVIVNIHFINLNIQNLLCGQLGYMINKLVFYALSIYSFLCCVMLKCFKLFHQMYH